MEDDIIENLKQGNFDRVKSDIWSKWITHLKNRHDYKNPRLNIYFQQNAKTNPTEAWFKYAAQDKGLRVEIMSFLKSTSSSLIESADTFIDLSAQPKTFLINSRQRSSDRAPKIIQ